MQVSHNGGHLTQSIGSLGVPSW